jgi:hypothetical protein
MHCFIISSISFRAENNPDQWENRSRVLDPRNLDDEVDRTLEEPQRTKKYVGQVIPMDLKKEY